MTETIEKNVKKYCMAELVHGDSTKKTKKKPLRAWQSSQAMALLPLQVPGKSHGVDAEMETKSKSKRWTSPFTNLIC